MPKNEIIDQPEELEDIHVGPVHTSHVDPMKGVSYVGHPIKELAGLSSEKIIHLLLHKNLPGKFPYKIFTKDLGRRAIVHDGIFDVLKTFPTKCHPMRWLINGIGRMGMLTKTNDYENDGLNLIARISELAAAIIRVRSGWGDPIPPEPGLGYVDNFVYMMGHPNPHRELSDVLEAFQIVHMDHGGRNISTFVGKAVASGRADMYASMMAAMAGLYGSRHGGASRECLEFVQKIAASNMGNFRKVVGTRLKAGNQIPGFGHSVLKVEDPRAEILYEKASQYFPEDTNIKICFGMREFIPNILDVSNLYPNVHAISGSLLHAVGFHDPNYYSVLFGWSRAVGIVAQIIDQESKS